MSIVPVLFMQAVAVVTWESLSRLSFCIKKCKLGDPEINVGGYVDSEDDFIIGSKKMLLFRKLLKSYWKNYKKICL